MDMVDITKLPEYVRNHELATISKENPDGEYENRAIPQHRIEEAEVVTSRLRDSFEEFHRPILDIDLPMHIVPSTTPGHGHLYIDKIITWEQYQTLLDALEFCGIIESGYLSASVARRF